MSDDATAPDLIGFRLTLAGEVYDWRLKDTSARHTRALRLATSVPGDPEAAWTESRLLQDILTQSYADDGIVVHAASMEAMACLIFLALLQRGEKPSWDRLLDQVVGHLEFTLEEIQPEEVDAEDPPA